MTPSQMFIMLTEEVQFLQAGGAGCEHHPSTHSLKALLLEEQMVAGNELGLYIWVFLKNLFKNLTQSVWEYWTNNT